MAGSIVLLDSGQKLITTTVDLNPLIIVPGGHAAATFLLNVTARTGTWTITFQYDIDGTFINIAVASAIVATGIVRAPLAADFSATRFAIPHPTRIVYNEDVAGDITATATAIYGD